MASGGQNWLCVCWRVTPGPSCACAAAVGAERDGARLWAGFGSGRLWSSSGCPGCRSCPPRAGASPGPSSWTCPEEARTCGASGDVPYAGLCGAAERERETPSNHSRD